MSEKKEEKIKRRDYLKYTGAAIGGLVVGGALGYLAKPAEVVKETVTAPAIEKTVTFERTIEKTVIPPLHFKDIKIHFHHGGHCPFGLTVKRGAEAATKDLGCDTSYFDADWVPETMVKQFKDSIAAKPDGIAVMGHPGYDGYAELFERAYAAGIIVTLVNVDIPELRKKYGPMGCGYVGQELYESGRKVGAACFKYGLKKGDRAAVFSVWEMYPRNLRAIGAEDALKEGGAIVDRVTHPPEVYGDPLKGIPYVTGYYAAHPDVKCMVWDGGGTTAGCVKYMEAIGAEPGKIINAGFDLSPPTIEAIEKGYLHVTLDQQPYLQGYLPIL
ncbi:MAG: substrate-binding domain-containing protein, partial [Nitrososphaerota archaeon]